MQLQRHSEPVRLCAQSRYSPHVPTRLGYPPQCRGTSASSDKCHAISDSWPLTVGTLSPVDDIWPIPKLRSPGRTVGVGIRHRCWAAHVLSGPRLQRLAATRRPTCGRPVPATAIERVTKFPCTEAVPLQACITSMRIAALHALSTRNCSAGTCTSLETLSTRTSSPARSSRYLR